MKKYIYLPLLAIVFISLMSACKKKEDPSPKQLSLTDKLTGNWRPAKLTVKGNDFTLLFTCILDDIITYQADGSYSEKVGANKCTEDETDEKGTWTLSKEGDKDILKVTSKGVTEQLTIVSLDTKSMEVSFKDDGVEGNVIFNKQ